MLTKEVSKKILRILEQKKFKKELEKFEDTSWILYSMMEDIYCLPEFTDELAPQDIIEIFGVDLRSFFYKCYTTLVTDIYEKGITNLRKTIND